MQNYTDLPVFGPVVLIALVLSVGLCLLVYHWKYIYNMWILYCGSAVFKNLKSRSLIFLVPHQMGVFSLDYEAQKIGNKKLYHSLSFQEKVECNYTAIR